MNHKEQTRRLRPARPDWLKIRLRTGGEYKRVKSLLSELSLSTVCEDARCPNVYECWGHGTATFLILGDVCTRHCGFCSVAKGKPGALDPREPLRVAEAVAALGLDYAVVTSVDRDDLPDGGAGHYAETIRAIKTRSPGCRVEVLIPDFNGNERSLETVLEAGGAGPDCLAHNVETVSHLYRRVRPVAVYTNSLKVLERSVVWRDRRRKHMQVKSGIMLGLGETTEQILDTLRDIAGTGCDVMTIGQYLAPKKRALAVEKYYSPEEFELLRTEGLRAGFKHVESGPLVRSSYRAKIQSEKTTCRSG